MDLTKLIFDHFNLNSPGVRVVARFVLKQNWDELEKYLTNPRLILEIISKNNREVANILMTDKGVRWFNWNVKHLYESLYYYTWGKNAKPRSPPPN